MPPGSSATLTGLRVHHALVTIGFIGFIPGVDFTKCF
jgi:hypothetical protein